MREIKFRAWAGGKFGHFHLSGNVIMWPSEHFFNQQLNSEASGIAFEGLDGFQQFTGLKDKNGVEIYEGDIVSSSKMYGKVCWAPHRAAWGIHGQLIERDWDACEVVGNVYANPELLEKLK